MSGQKATLDWLGCATFRLTVGELVIFLDAYMDRVPSAPPVGMTTNDVGHADWILIGHSHFDHLWGADRIALSTGAKVIGSYETTRVLMAQGVPREQLVPVAGGERVLLGDGVSVRVFPSLQFLLPAPMSTMGTRASPSRSAAGRSVTTAPAEVRALPPALPPWCLPRVIA
jgi:L-ascorbate metabolism protein UlaG (beta-lactamase superfamily)